MPSVQFHPCLSPCQSFSHVFQVVTHLARTNNVVCIFIYLYLCAYLFLHVCLSDIHVSVSLSVRHFLCQSHVAISMPISLFIFVCLSVIILDTCACLLKYSRICLSLSVYHFLSHSSIYLSVYLSFHACLSSVHVSLYVPMCSSAPLSVSSVYICQSILICMPVCWCSYVSVRPYLSICSSVRLPCNLFLFVCPSAF